MIFANWKNDGTFESGRHQSQFYWSVDDLGNDDSVDGCLGCILFSALFILRGFANPQVPSSWLLKIT